MSSTIGKIQIKRRYLISAFITAFIMFLAHSLYLINIPLKASISLTNLTGKSKTNISVEVADNLYFKDRKKDSKRIYLEANKPSLYEYNIQDIKVIRHARILLSALNPNDIYELSILYLGKKNKYKLDDLNAYSSYDADILIEDGKIKIKPRSSSCMIVYEKELNGIKPQVDFDFYIFTIILILSYLVSLKLVDYLADFKNLKNYSRIEIVFLTVFFLLLFIPMSHIDDSEKSKTENRFLAKFKPLITKEGTINYTFGKDYEAYFNDRFYLRDFMCSLYMNLQYFSKDIIETSKVIFDKKSNYILYKNRINIILRQEQVNRLIWVFDNFNSFCSQNNIKLYILVVPDNTEIYYPKIISHVNENNVLNNIKKIKEIKEKTLAKVIFPYDELKEVSKRDYTHFKVDNHWTDFGAYTAYGALISEIQKDFPNVEKTLLSEYKITYNNLIRSEQNRKYDNALFLRRELPSYNWNAKNILDVNYRYYDRKNSNELIVKNIDDNNNAGKFFYFDKGPNIKALSIGTSMNENLNGFLPYSFKNLKYIRLNHNKQQNREIFKVMKYYKKDILEYKPQILILCITMDNLNYINGLFMEEK